MCANIRCIVDRCVTTVIGTWHDAIFDAWQKSFFLRFGLKLCGGPTHTSTLFNLSRLKQCLSQANISQWRSITLVKNCLWWGFSFDTKRRPVIIFFGTIHSLWRGGGDAFPKLVLIMGQVVLDAFSHLRLWGGGEARGSPDFKPSHFLRAFSALSACHVAGKPLLFPIYVWNLLDFP